MASSRVMRKSPRNASPSTNAAHGTPGLEIDTTSRRERSDTGDDWVEPSLRTPVPSFEDHRGLERQGVLEQMAPLGTMPSNQKVRLRLKQWHPQGSKEQPEQKKNGQDVTSGGSGTGGGGAADVENSGSERPRRTETRRSEEAKRSSLRDKDEDPDYTPKHQVKQPAPKAVLPSPIVGARPTASTPQGRENLRIIVDSAAKRAKEIGNELVGLCIRRVYDDSLRNKDVAVTLDAVLMQEATEDQTLAFQNYIKLARRAIKRDMKAAIATATAPVEASGGRAATLKAQDDKSSTKRTRRSTSRHIASNFNERNTSTPSRSRARTNGAMNGDGDPRPSKRQKRSGSVSSDSSALSSTQSLDLEKDQQDIMKDTKDLPGLRTRSNKNGGSAPQLNSDYDNELVAKKAKLKRAFDDYSVQDSAIRPDPSPAPPKQDRRKFPKIQVPTPVRNNAEEYEDLASPASSLAGEFLVPPPPEALRVSRSRGSTPNALGRPRNAVRRMARVKMSPNKKKTGPTGGRESSRLRERERDAGGTAADDSESGDGDNNDHCTACGGGGELLCCDGCPRSFHFQCLDPPLSSPPEGEWVCHDCESRRQPRARPHRALFSLIKDQMRKLNPRQFSLPDYMRNYFEGMKTGEDGEYEEVSHLKPKQRMLGHDDPEKDNLKLKDGKGKFVLCFKCGKSSLGRREIIACDYCTLKWHLDCLNPPLANPPIRDPHNSNRAKNSWMCPAHAPIELETVGFGGQATHKLRKPRNAKVVESMLRRGLKNNGIIEIENDPSDDETGYDNDDNIIYRVTEKSIKLDFIDRVHKTRHEHGIRQTAAMEAARKRIEEEAIAQRNSDIAFNLRNFIEKDAAINLLQFASAGANLDLGAEKMQPLINALINEAPDETIALIQQDEEAGDANPVTPNGTNLGHASKMATPPGSDTQDRTLSKKQKQSYLLLMELIQNRLREAENAE